MLELSFTKPGLYTTVQDDGRAEFHSYGIPPGGPMDRASARRANWLVGNALTNPTLEITVMGPEMTFDGPAQIALTGGDISAKVNGVSVSLNESMQIKTNDRLSFGRLQSGARCYLAIGGAWQVERWLGSASAASIEVDLLTPGAIVRKGDRLRIEGSHIIDARALDWSKQANLENAPIRVVPGPEMNKFYKSIVADFFASDHHISNRSNRMGYRLESDIKLKTDFEMISSGTVPGVIQGTNSGQPIILMADAQTAGGYPRFGCVASIDLDRLGQMKPGDMVRFDMISVAESQKLWRERQALEALMFKSV